MPRVGLGHDQFGDQLVSAGMPSREVDAHLRMLELRRQARRRGSGIKHNRGFPAERFSQIASQKIEQCQPRALERWWFSRPPKKSGGMQQVVAIDQKQHRSLLWPLSHALRQ